MGKIKLKCKSYMAGAVGSPGDVIDVTDEIASFMLKTGNAVEAGDGDELTAQPAPAKKKKRTATTDQTEVDR